MRGARIFGEAWLDGFTMAGLRKLHRPGAADTLFAPEDGKEDISSVLFAVSKQDGEQVRMEGDLRQLPSGALNSIMRAVAAEQKSRVAQKAFARGSRG